MKVFAYGAKPPTDGADIVAQQIARAHRYYNVLIGLERERRDAVKAVQGELVATLKEAYADAAESILALGDPANEKLVDQLVLAQAGKPVKWRLGDGASALAWEFAWRAWAKSRQALDTQTAPINERHKERMREERSRNGTFWGTYLQIEEAVMRAVQSTPLSSPLHGRPWNEEGVIAVQIQGGMTSAELLEGKDSRARILGEGRHRELSIRVGSEGRTPVWARFPLCYHRDLPEGASIKWVRVHRRKVATHHIYSAQVVLSELPTPVPIPPLGIVAIDVGWRRFPGEGMRVAVWADDSGKGGELRVPERLLTRWQKVDDLRSIRDKNFNAALKVLVEARKAATNWPPEMHRETTHLHAWESPARLADLVWRWRNRRFDGDAALYDTMEAWRKQDKHLYEWECFDEETEVLTRDGWKFWRNASQKDLFASVNLDSDCLEYQAPTKLIARPFKGEMIQIGGEKRSRVDLLVTPEHRMVIHSQSGKTKVIPAASLRRSHRLKIKVGLWKGSDREMVSVPAATNNFRASLPAIDLKAELVAEFLGWYVAEGFRTKQKSKDEAHPNSVAYHVVICQKSEDGRLRIKRLLQQLPWSWSVERTGFQLSNRQVFDLVSACGDGAQNKRVPQWIKDSSQPVIRAFVEAAIHGDGTWRPDGGASYFTVSPLLADDIQELFLKLGYGTSLSSRLPSKSILPGGYHGKRNVYYVQRQLRGSASLRDSGFDANFKSVAYDGMVYCASVPNETLIVRRHGKVVVCGNCNQRENVLRARREVYRLFAKQMARYKTVVVERLDLRDFAEHPAPGEAKEPPELVAARGRRHFAALSELLGCLAQMTAKDGAKLLETNPADSTSIHASCGSKEDVGSKLMHTCSSCGEVYDQDENAAKNLLGRVETPKTSASKRVRADVRNAQGHTPAEARRQRGLEKRRSKRPAAAEGVGG